MSSSSLLNGWQIVLEKYGRVESTENYPDLNEARRVLLSAYQASIKIPKPVRVRPGEILVRYSDIVKQQKEDETQIVAWDGKTALKFEEANVYNNFSNTSVKARPVVLRSFTAYEVVEEQHSDELDGKSE